MPGPLATRLLTILSRSRKPDTERRPQPPGGSAPDFEQLSRRILLPSLQVSDEELARAAHQDRGQRLARQEMWPEICAEIRAADTTRLATPGGESAAMLLAYGARGDVVAVAEDTLHGGDTPAPDGLAALENALDEHPHDYACALVVAMAHVDIGWAWQTARQTPAGKRRFHHHFDRAADILAPFSGVALDAPSLAAAQCALLAAEDRPGIRVADDFEDLIDLDPKSPRHMRALGQNLLPGRFGSLDALELQARRTAARTGDIWGAGAYTWVYFDALASDHTALTGLDTDFFIEGLKDILSRTSEQHVANLIAAFCAVSMAPTVTDEARQLPAAAEAARARLHDCLGWVLQDHLHELHPLLWSQALLSPGLTPPLPSRRALVNKGRHTALLAIATRFADDIEDGYNIAFSPKGMYRLPGT